MNFNYIESKSNDPMYNLSLEQYVFDELPKDRSYFMLWQNDNSIIVGKNQNTIEEINEDMVKEKNVNVVRRLSGGGAVYHDMGNLNFTFIADSDNMESIDMALFIKPIIATLAELGVTAEMTGRNDIVIDGQKFSGNSQYIKKGRVMHHGTIMFDSDLELVPKLLNVSKHKIQSKGLKSVKSRITTIKKHLDKDITLQEFMDALKKNVFQGVDIDQYTITEEDNKKINEIKENRYATWEWNYGYSPKYSIVKKNVIENCGEVELHMDVKDGKIQGFVTYGDYFGSGDIKELEQLLMGTQLTEKSLEEVIADIDINHYYNNMSKEAFIDLILN